MEAGGLKKKRPPKAFRSVEGVRRFVARVLADLDDANPMMDVDRARCMFAGAKLLAELIENSSLERRIEALETRAAHRETQPSVSQ